MLILCWLNLHFTVFLHFPDFQDRGRIAPEKSRAISAWAVLFSLSTNCPALDENKSRFFHSMVGLRYITICPLWAKTSLCVTTGRSDFAGRKRFLHPCCQVSSELGLCSCSQHQGLFPNSWNQSHTIFPQAHVWKAQTYFPIEVKVYNHPIYFKDIINSAL